jgi:hypothetical protein
MKCMAREANFDPVLVLASIPWVKRHLASQQQCHKTYIETLGNNQTPCIE